jgi:hypothetical protein
MSREGLLERIRQLAVRPDGLFRVHRTHPGIYARARRQFGTWAQAVAAAGIDYEQVLRKARTRSLRLRGRRTRVR